MYLTDFEVEIASNKDILKVHFDSFSSNDILRVSDANGLEVLMQKEKFENGTKDFYLGMNNSMKFEFPVTPQVAMLTGEVYARYIHLHHYKFSRMMETAEFKPKMVAGDHHHFAFVGEDESVWGLGYRV